MRLKEGIYIRDFIFGVEDGLVSTLGFVIGVTMAAISNRIIIIAGLAEVVAAALSMAAGTYISIKSQKEFLYARRKKHFHVEESPIKGALVMFAAFILGSVFPLAPYFFITAKKAAIISGILTIASLFFFGSMKAKLTNTNMFKSGVEMTIVGLIAAGAGIIVGVVSKLYFGI